MSVAWVFLVLAPLRLTVWVLVVATVVVVVLIALALARHLEAVRT
jgi:hypothetical protein